MTFEERRVARYWMRKFEEFLDEIESDKEYNILRDREYNDIKESVDSVYQDILTTCQYLDSISE